jgi:hypothetical protein
LPEVPSAHRSNAVRAWLQRHWYRGKEHGCQNRIRARSGPSNLAASRLSGAGHPSGASSLVRASSLDGVRRQLGDSRKASSPGVRRSLPTPAHPTVSRLTANLLSANRPSAPTASPVTWRRRNRESSRFAP